MQLLKYWDRIRSGFCLALTSLGVLIYFIHHVAVSIQADEIIARVSGELTERIERLSPERIGRSLDEASDPPSRTVVPEQRGAPYSQTGMAICS